MQSTSFKVGISKGKAQSSTAVDDSTSCDSSEGTKRFTAQDIKLQTNMSYADKLRELEYRSAQTILLEKKIQNMRLRWANKIPSLKLESGQILADDELLVDYSAVVQANANDAHEKITKTIKEALALLRRYYETLETLTTICSRYWSVRRQDCWRRQSKNSRCRLREVKCPCEGKMNLNYKK